MTALPQARQFYSHAADLDQNRLNISNRSRTSRLPWRGQFSPEFIEYLLSTVCNGIQSVYDPFCGSGTVLFEALRRDVESYGCEINPAAWHMAKLAEFSSLPADERNLIVHELRAAVASAVRSTFGNGEVNVVELIGANYNSMFTKFAVAAAILVGMGNNPTLTRNGLLKGAQSTEKLLFEARQSNARSIALLGDARSSILPNESIDAVITSPPYINVFNYHQNYRLGAELMGWKPLQAARSEIGANRKFRQNRFLTVVQYCIDIQQTIFETTRLLKNSGHFIIVLGRTSNVLGAAFQNGKIISKLIEADGNLEITRSAERVFTSRFGEAIYEDIFFARKVGLEPISVASAKVVGRDALNSALDCVPDKNRALLLEAIDQAENVTASPMLDLAVPPTFR